MNKETERKLAASLTSQSIEILPFIPYFLQDFFELGSSPKD
ncbi:TPA: SAM-dependent methyltransferase, partial [Listeria monocytogenes]|nr:SAM-dependent methyltransferase [Listeria monocytogenes]